MRSRCICLSFRFKMPTTPASCISLRVICLQNNPQSSVGDFLAPLLIFRRPLSPRPTVTRSLRREGAEALPGG